MLGGRRFWGWGSCLTIVLASHGYGLWAMLAPPVTPLPIPPQSAMMMVELGAPASATVKEIELTPGQQQVQARPQAAAKPQPKKHQIKERVVAKSEMALPRPTPPKTAVPQTEAPPQPVSQPDPTPAKVAAETTSMPASSNAPDSEKTAAPSPGLSRLSSITGQTDWRDELLTRLQKHLRYPDIARGRRYEGVVYVHIAMNCQGRLLHKSIRQKSGHNELDSEALDVVERAQPLPAPDSAPNDRVELIVPVHFSLR